MSTHEEWFVWDKGKALANERKHLITFELATTVFNDPLRTTFYDRDHADSEQHWVVVGMTDNGLLLLVICAAEESEEGYYVRLISARKATLRERRAYESGDSVREPEAMDEYTLKLAPESKADDDYDDGMKDEYDLSNAVRGAFMHWRLPIQIDSEVLGYFHTRSVKLGIDSTEAINEILRVHVELPAERAGPVEVGIIDQALLRHFGLPPRPKRPTPVEPPDEPDPSAFDDYDDGMKDEYDFSNAKRGVFKNCRMPTHIDNEVLGYFHTRSVKLGINTTEAINEILRVHVGLPAKRTEPVETFREALRRHFGVPVRPAKPSRRPDVGAGADEGAGTGNPMG